MELRVPHMLHLFNIYHENKDSDNCAKVLEEEECIKMFGTKSLNDERDYNVVTMNYLNIHDANDTQSHKLGDAMFDEDDIFVPQVLMSKFIMMKASLLSMMIIMMTHML